MQDPLLREQIDYYRARADEYDQWFLREGRHDLGPERNALWNAEVQYVEQQLAALDLRGRVLELAGGTGFWTRRLADTAAELTVVDASAETLELNRRRVGRPDVRYIVADVFQWRPDSTYDAVVFTFWLSHVPPELFPSFWDLVGRCLAPGGRVFFVDSKGPESTTSDQHQLRPGDISVSRELNDGRTFHIYKLFYSPQELQQRLHALGWEAELATTENFLLYGVCARSG
jgi:demethylmenaquinone methyltransferase/2-methoxy-6-polyprenyl-1,4-benzoquinol methylase